MKWSVYAGVLLALLLLSVHAQVRPQVPANYVSGLFLTTPQITGNGTISVQTWQSRTHLKIFTSFLGIPFDFESFGDDLHQEYVTVLEGQCRNASKEGLSELFAWVPIATYGGQMSVDGLACSQWLIAHSGSSANVSGCFMGDVPLQLNISRPEGLTEFTFVGFSGGKLNLEMPQLCEVPRNVCTASQPLVQTLEMVRFHPQGNMDIANDNTADMLGDSVFVCISRVQGTYQNYGEVSLLQVDVDTRYGQYALCNNGVCVGGEAGTVGREISLGPVPWGGQCAASSPELGWWYSLPASSECSAGQTVGNGCAWQLRTVVKTISYDCLESHGFEEKCPVAAPANFLPAAAVMRAALLSSDPSQGGCPNLPSPRITSAARGEHRLASSPTSQFAEGLQRTFRAIASL